MKNKSLALRVKLSSIIAFLAATGCAEYHKRVLHHTEEKGPEFTRTLAQEYETLGNTEQAIMYDECSANYYFCKAIRAKGGCPVQPTLLDKWTIEEEKLPELMAARERLIQDLQFGGWEVAPKMAAHAQAHFDCWVEQQAENWQLQDIASCRSEFYNAIAEVELMLMGGILNVLPANMVFFDFGSTYINADAMTVLDQVANIAATKQFIGHLLLVGRTDKIGDANHNKKLSEQRAMMVKKELIRRGIPPHRISVKGVGESPGPKVDAHNRRVDILFLEHKPTKRHRPKP